MVSGGDGFGGGLYSNDPCGTVSIADCLIVANKCKGGLGGFIRCGTIQMEILLGVASIEPAELLLAGPSEQMRQRMGQEYNGPSNVNSCILWDINEQNSIPISDITGGAIVRYCNIKNGYAGEENIDIDPCFVKLGYWVEVNVHPPLPFMPPQTKLVWVEGDYHLLIDSPCIDTGDPNLCGWAE